MLAIDEGSENYDKLFNALGIEKFKEGEAGRIIDNPVVTSRGFDIDQNLLTQCDFFRDPRFKLPTLIEIAKHSRHRAADHRPGRRRRPRAEGESGDVARRRGTPDGR
jgi:hypothetical protein